MEQRKSLELEELEQRKSLELEESEQRKSLELEELEQKFLAGLREARENLVKSDMKLLECKGELKKKLLECKGELKKAQEESRDNLLRVEEEILGKEREREHGILLRGIRSRFIERDAASNRVRLLFEWRMQEFENRAYRMQEFENRAYNKAYVVMEDEKLEPMESLKKKEVPLKTNDREMIEVSVPLKLEPEGEKLFEDTGLDAPMHSQLRSPDHRHHNIREKRLQAAIEDNVREETSQDAEEEVSAPLKTNDREKAEHNKAIMIEQELDTGLGVHEENGGSHAAQVGDDEEERDDEESGGNHDGATKEDAKKKIWLKLGEKEFQEKGSRSRSRSKRREEMYKIIEQEGDQEEAEEESGSILSSTTPAITKRTVKESYGVPTSDSFQDRDVEPAHIMREMLTKVDMLTGAMTGSVDKMPTLNI